MAHDLVIRGGEVADGLGGEPFMADVAVDAGTIVAVGDVQGGGTEEIDAEGQLVTPGFVDIHTHYDGQATWGSYTEPSCWHGVTTAVMGNCGVGFAPVRPDAHDRLIELMEGVEDIPGAVLHEGIDWTWQSFGEYLDAVERRPHDIDLCAQLPHGALRLYVMGERAARLEEATEEDAATMRRLTAEAMAAGALGFSTSRTLNHRTASGDPTPSLKAGSAELEAIVLGVADAGHGVVELISDFSPDAEGEFAMVRRLVELSGRPLSVSLAQSHDRPEAWRGLLGQIERAAADGLPIRAQVAPRPVGLLLGLQSSFHPFSGNPVFGEVAGRPLEEQVRALRDPGFRSRLLESSRSGGRGRRLVDPSRMFPLGDVPDYEPSPETSVQRLAETRGVDPAELTIDLLTENDGRAFLLVPFLNYADGNLDACGEMLSHPDTLFGLGDGGAHVGIISDASFPTWFLSHWSRDRSHGRMPVGRVVERLASNNARAVGLLDRGVVATGMKADLNVIDFDHLRCQPPEMAYDLPAGGKRLLQRARGYTATVVSGQVTYRDGEPTGALPAVSSAAVPREGRQMSIETPEQAVSPARTLHELEPAAEWRAADVADPDAWTLRLDAADHAELHAALAHAKAKNTDPLEIGRADFPLEGLVPKLERMVDVLLNGRGFARIATLDVDRYSDEDLTLLYWGIGLHLGEPWAQNKHGHVLGDVTDQGKRIDDPTVRGNELGGIALDYHTDGSDLVGLLCLRAARAGGLSCVANAVAIHNQMVRETPELAAALYEPMPYDTRGEQAAGAAAFYRVPAFTEHAGRLFVRFIPQYILASQRHADAPRLSTTAREAIARMSALANDPDFNVYMDLQPGEMQFINNYHVLHGRTAYEDDVAHGYKRHLKRLWLATYALSERPSYFAALGRRNHWESKRSVSSLPAVGRAAHEEAAERAT